MLNLRGAAILITRPLPQARGMASLVTTAGGIAIVQPCIQIAAAPEDEDTLDQLDDLDRFSAAVFTSPNAVQHAMQRAPRKMWPPSLPLYAVGSSTQRALLQMGFPKVTAPAEEASGGAALAPLLLEQQQSGARVLIVAAPGGRTDLAETLARRGIEISWCYCYRRLPAELLTANVNPIRLEFPRLITVATSEFILERVSEMIDKIQTRPLVVPSTRLRERARDLGFAIVGVSTRPKDRALLEATMRFIQS